VNKPDRLIHSREIAEVMTADSEGRHLCARTSEGAIKHVALARGRRRRLSWRRIRGENNLRGRCNTGRHARDRYATFKKVPSSRFHVRASQIFAACSRLAIGRPNPIGLTIHYERTARQSRNQTRNISRKGAKHVLSDIEGAAKKKRLSFRPKGEIFVRSLAFARDDRPCLSLGILGVPSTSLRTGLARANPRFWIAMGHGKFAQAAKTFG
jgi:hypothetical protein